MRLEYLLLCLCAHLCCGKVFEKCELAAELKFKHGFTQEQVQDWVCIAEYESTFNSSAINHFNWDKSKDFGLFQLNNRYWCGSDTGDNVCKIECEALLDSDLSDDIACAQRIVKDTKRWMKVSDGLVAWVAYVKRCQDKDLKAYIAECSEALSTPPVTDAPEVPITELSTTPDVSPEAEVTADKKKDSSLLPVRASGLGIDKEQKGKPSSVDKPTKTSLPVRASGLGGVTEDVNKQESETNKKASPSLPTRASGLGDDSEDIKQQIQILPTREGTSPSTDNVKTSFESANIPKRDQGFDQDIKDTKEELSTPVKNTVTAPKGSVLLSHSADDTNVKSQPTLIDIVSPPRGSIALFDSHDDKAAEKDSYISPNIPKDLIGSRPSVEEPNTKYTNANPSSSDADMYHSLISRLFSQVESQPHFYDPHIAPFDYLPLVDSTYFPLLKSGYLTHMAVPNSPRKTPLFRSQLPSKSNLFSKFSSDFVYDSSPVENYPLPQSKHTFRSRPGQYESEDLSERSWPKFQFEKVKIPINIPHPEIDVKPINIDLKKFTKPIPQFEVNPINIPKPEFALVKVPINIPKPDLSFLKPKPIRIPTPQFNFKPISIPKPEFNIKPIKLQKPEVNFKPVIIGIPKPEFNLKPVQLPKFNFQKVSIPKIKIPVKQISLPEFKPISIPKFELKKFDLPKLELPKFEIPKFEFSKPSFHHKY